MNQGKSIKIKCKHDELVDPKLLKEHPRNPNEHGQDQIERLVDLYNYQGIRHPIIVSRQSGLMVVGHGRRMAAIRCGMKEFPVEYQDFDNEDQEYAFMVSDNAVSEWAELNMAKINQNVINLGPDFNLDMLGIKNFVLDVSDLGEFNPSETVESDKEHKTCPHCGEEL